MDHAEDVLSNVMNLVTTVVEQNGLDAGVGGCEMLLDEYRRAAHALIEQYLEKSDCARHKSLYDAGLAAGFYGSESSIACGVLSKAVSICEMDRIAVNANCLTIVLICAGHVHGRWLRELIEGERKCAHDNLLAKKLEGRTTRDRIS